MVLEAPVLEVILEEEHKVEVNADSSSSSKWKTGVDIRHFVQGRKVWASYLPRLLKSIAYYFTESSATVVFALLDMRQDADVVAQIIDFGRMLVMQSMEQFACELFPGQTLCAALVPHKRQFVGSKWIYQCGSLREALVYLPEDHKDDLNHATVYAYLGGGVPHQPPHTYGIVVRNLPIDVADHLCALVHSHAFAVCSQRNWHGSSRAN